jgi:hypothetical protein
VRKLLTPVVRLSKVLKPVVGFDSLSFKESTISLFVDRVGELEGCVGLCLVENALNISNMAVIVVLQEPCLNVSMSSVSAVGFERESSVALFDCDVSVIGAMDWPPLDAFCISLSEVTMTRATVSGFSFGAAFRVLKRAFVGVTGASVKSSNSVAVSVQDSAITLTGLIESNTVCTVEAHPANRPPVIGGNLTPNCRAPVVLFVDAEFGTMSSPFCFRVPGQLGYFPCNSLKIAIEVRSFCLYSRIDPYSRVQRSAVQQS